MPDTFDYIFRSLGETKFDISVLEKRLKSQSRTNWTFALFAMTAATYIYMADKEIKKLKKEVKKLNDRVTEGEFEWHD